MNVSHRYDRSRGEERRSLRIRSDRLLQWARMAEPGVGAPAIPFETLREGLKQFCFDDRTLRTLERDDDFRALQFRSHQIFYVSRFSLAQRNIELSIGQLERGFNCARTTVRRALKNELEPPKLRGRHDAISDDSENKILAWLRQQAEKSQPATRTDILHYCVTNFGRSITRGWVDSFLGRHLDDLKEATSHPQENPRLQIPREFLVETLRCMDQAVQGCVRDLVFNLDEVGASEWEDRKSKRVVVPAEMGDQPIHHGINRNLKHITIVTCVAASGEHLIPYVVTSQDAESLRTDLKKRGIEFGRHLTIVRNQKPYVNSGTFADYIKSVFLPYVTRVRKEREIEEEEAVLLMDNCPSHLTSEVITLLTTARVRVVTFAPHTTHIFQLLDLTLFGAFKRVGQYQLPFDDITTTSRFIYRLYIDFLRTLTPPNIWAAFGAIGVEFDVTQTPYRVIFHPEKLQESKGFKELWDIDFPLDALSTRRRRSPFGWLNKPE